MKLRLLIISLVGVGISLAMAPAKAESVEKRQVYKEFETANGNTVQVQKRGRTDHQGNAQGARRYRVTNDEGKVIARGKQQGRKTANGNRAKRSVQQRRTPNGGVTTKRVRKHKAG